MLEGSMPSIWASMFSWFTPTVLFVLTNVMIATIVATSIFGTQKNQPEDENRPQLVRTSSVLERLRSFSLYRYRSGEMDPFPSSTTLPPADTETQQTPEPAEEETLQDQGPDPAHAYQVHRIKSDTKPASGEMPVKLSRKLKKSASAKSAFAHFEEKEIVDSIRPSTTKDGKSKGSELQRFGEDEEVDARADDFINRFKQQLKLQRLDSILRYKEMLNRGAG